MCNVAKINASCTRDAVIMQQSPCVIQACHAHLEYAADKEAYRSSSPSRTPHFPSCDIQYHCNSLSYLPTILLFPLILKCKCFHRTTVPHVAYHLHNHTLNTLFLRKAINVCLRIRCDVFHCSQCCLCLFNPCRYLRRSVYPVFRMFQKPSI